MKALSICIPRIDDSVNKYNLFHSLRKLFLGRIDKIDIVTNKKTQNRRAFIHYNKVYVNEKTTKIIDTLNNGGYINVVYDFPNYWRCYKSIVHNELSQTHPNGEWQPNSVQQS